MSRRCRAIVLFVISAVLACGYGVLRASDEGSISFNLTQLPAFEKGKPFRISLCTGQILGPDDPAPRCNPKTARSVTGGHEADYVFSPGHGKNYFLPKGLHLDGFGVLSGTPETDLTKTPINVCVRQLFEESCKDIRFVPQQAAGGKKAQAQGGGAAKGLIFAGVGGGAAILGAVELKKQLDAMLKDSVADTPSDNCGTKPTMPAPGWGYCKPGASFPELCATAQPGIQRVQTWCSCMHLTYNSNTGTCQ